MNFEVSDLVVSCGTQNILRGVNFSVPKNKITAIIGPSGCGKSSLLKCLNRMIDLEPGLKMTGRILWDSRDLCDEGLSLSLIRRKIGMIFQKPNPFPLSIYKNMELALKEHFSLDSTQRREKIEKALRQVGLWDEVRGRLHRSALKLSGGQQQRLCLARALVLDPEVLLLDEPCSALDPLSTRLIEELLMRLKSQITSIIVTHNLPQAQRISDHILVFWQDNESGFLVEEGTAKKVMTSSENKITRSYVNGQLG